MSAALLDVEVIGADCVDGVPSEAEIQRLCDATARAAGLQDGHLAVEFVDAQRIATLNELHRDIDTPTDVLSFPIDGFEGHPGVERELGDVVICPEHTEDLQEAIVHGVLHLLGMDHETDDGEMLALQAKILAGERAAQLAGEQGTRLSGERGAP